MEVKRKQKWWSIENQNDAQEKTKTMVNRKSYYGEGENQNGQEKIKMVFKISTFNYEK